MAEYIKIRSPRQMFADAYAQCVMESGGKPLNWEVSPALMRHLESAVKGWTWINRDNKGYTILGVPVQLVSGRDCVPQYVRVDSTKEWV